jgi:hypothetical protein
MDTDDAKACRGRAERIRGRAEEMPNSESRVFMLKLSEDYERLADAIESVAGVIPPWPKTLPGS